MGQVKAIDADEGQNAVIHYSLPEDVPFIVDVNSGDLRTSMALDYEKQPVGANFRGGIFGAVVVYLLMCCTLLIAGV